MLISTSIELMATDKVVPPKVSVAASASQHADRTAGSTTANIADSADKKQTQDVSAVSQAQITQSLADINAMLSARSVSVQFQIDPAFKEAILQVVDQHSGKVLLQLPSVEAVRIARTMEHMKGVLVAQKV